MSIATEISRLLTDKNTIRAKLVELGMATNTDNLTTLAEAIDALINQGAVTVQVREGETYTIPAGYHSGSGTVSGVAGGGNYSTQSKTVTPTKKQQHITPDDGYYALDSVTVQAIPDAYQDVSSVTTTAGEVLTGKVFVTANGDVIAGTMPNIGSVSKTLDVTTITFKIQKGYHDGSGTVEIVLEQKTVTPTKETQEITPTQGKVLSKVVVSPIPENYIDTNDAEAEAGHILINQTAYVKGVKLTGTMPSNGDTSKTIDGLTMTSVAIPAGHTSGGTVSLTTDIEDALKAI